MSFFFPQRAGESKLKGYIDSRTSNAVPGNIKVTNNTALRHSAVWACVRLRADMLSTFPVDVYRKVAGVRVEVPVPGVFEEPGGPDWPWVDWAWATQADLDKTGNAIGLITARNGALLPSRIEPVPIDQCKIIWKANTPMRERKYRIGNKEYTVDEVWHERQFPVSGQPIGLSPVAYAAWSIGEYLNIQDFILQWFGGGGVPKARLKNKEKIVKSGEASAIKERYKATVQHGDIFVHGNDWEYDFIQAQNVGMEWLDAKRYGLSDVCRFFGCPADVIDAAVSAGGAITYANITERNLQLLIHHLGPMVFRREKKWTTLLPKPRYVKLNTNALMRMDPKATAEYFASRIKSMTMTVTEARELDERAPLTPEQIAEFKELFGDPNKVAPTNVEPKIQKALAMMGAAE